ncbi:hypothetical protein NX722_23385 [Endozoicomonas gorgoniicola]|uniref:DUF2157 domain-containing protein n=1 Tax=Endozoicomonas gorgoniicola TaxID=1234144 RepID=A0ABT3N1K5_9GAMM|nr:hypothetical protein [Endozoicomonas gorgoniicola]MCW7555513.1 hypothetical protein [Endozoicomonas gorgoniicola]
MQLNRKDRQVLNQLLNFWVDKELLTSEQSARLQQSVTVKKTGWQLLARYAFYCTVVCGVLAIVAVMMDDRLIELLLKLFDASAMVKSAGFAVAAALVLSLGYRFGKKAPNRLYTRESLYFLGVLLIAASDWFLGKALDTGSGHYSVLLLSACFIYAVAGLVLSSRTLWLFALGTLFWWFVEEIGYQTEYAFHLYGMNIFIWFSLFSALVLCSSYLCSSYLMPHSPRTRLFFPMTKTTGLLCLFSGLWGLAVFGNYDSAANWKAVSQFELWQWNLPLAISSGVAVWVGAKWDDDIYQRVGISFFILLIYTMFFEYVWDVIHQALFFVLLGLSFWALSHFAEKIWLKKQR